MSVTWDNALRLGPGLVWHRPAPSADWCQTFYSAAHGHEPPPIPPLTLEIHPNSMGFGSKFGLRISIEIRHIAFFYHFFKNYQKSDVLFKKCQNDNITFSTTPTILCFVVNLEMASWIACECSFLCSPARGSGDCDNARERCKTSLGRPKQKVARA